MTRWSNLEREEQFYYSKKTITFLEVVTHFYRKWRQLDYQDLDSSFSLSLGWDGHWSIRDIKGSVQMDKSKTNGLGEKSICNRC